MPRRRGELVPAAPFAEWLNKRVARAEADYEIHSWGGVTPLAPADRVAAELGWHGAAGQRRLYRHRYMLEATNDSRVSTAEHSTETFSRAVVEDALDHAGVPFEDVYPELADDVALEPRAYCLQCRDDVLPINGVCPWCHSGVATRPSRSVYRRGQGRRLTDAQVRAAYRLHIDGGLSIPAIAERLYQRAGYPSAKTCAGALRIAFSGLGLQRREVVGAQIVRSARLSEEDKARERDARRKREQRAKRPRCSATTSYGAPCPVYAMAGSDTCWKHSEEGRAQQRENLLRNRHQRSGAVPEPVLCRAVAMHKDGMSTTEIGQRLVGFTRSKSPQYVAKVVRDELRRVGVYRFIRPNMTKKEAA